MMGPYGVEVLIPFRVLTFFRRQADHGCAARAALF